MAYDKGQVDQEFTRWSNSYDRSILQWLLFGPSHRVLIRRIRDVAGDRPLKMLDVGCGTGVFASRVREALPKVEVCGVDLVSEMLKKGKPRWRLDRGHVLPGARRQRAAAVRVGGVRHRDLCQQLPPLPPAGPRRRRDAAGAAARRAIDDHRRLPRRPLGLVHL